MPSDVILWILGSVIAFSFAIIGFLVRFLFGKASHWGDKLDQVVSDLRLINRDMKAFAERADKHDSEIQSLRSRLHQVNDRLSQVISLFDMLRFTDCKDDCPLSRVASTLHEKGERL